LRQSFDVLVVGRLFCDLIFTGLTRMPSLGEERFAPGLTITAGGGAFITGAWLRRLGLNPGIVSEIGRDPFSDEIARALADHDLDAALVRRHDGPMPQITVAMPVGDERAFLTHLAPGPSGSLASRLEPHLVGRSRPWLHVSELATLVAHPDLVALARRTGATLSLDPSWDEELFRDSLAQELLEAVDLLLPNEAEALALTGAASVEEALSELAARIPSVVVTCGPNGALAALGGKRICQSAVPVREVVDSTGAGDAFNAGVIATLIAGGSLAEALRRGAECGAAAVSAVGGAPSLEAAA
jgi:sugar/nucleoside kinase (ribokinase family)